MDQLEKTRHKVTRWRILKILDTAGAAGASVALVEQALSDAELLVTRGELLQELDYLEGSGLIACEKESGIPTSVKLRPWGMDIVQYMVECPPGIARPPMG